MEQERYTLEQPQEEAARMSEKVKSGEATSYGEAEKMVRPGGVELSVDGIKRAAEELKAKVEAAKLQRERDIEQKVSEMESLIAEAKSTYELLGTAQETLDYFTSVQELGQLDRDDTKKLEELQKLVTSLENQRAEIEKKIGAISERPEVQEKLQDAAKKEETERVVKELVEQAWSELYPQIDQLVKAIMEFRERDIFIEESANKQGSEASLAQKDIENAFKRAGDMLSKKSNFGYTLQRITRSGSPEEWRERLTEERKSLGMFKGKEKAAVDYILSHGLAFGKYHKAMEQIRSLEEQRESLRNTRSEFAEQFKNIMAKSWEKQEKMGQPEKTSGIPDLPYDLWRRLEQQIEKLGEKNKQGDDLRYLYKIITNEAGGYTLVYKNPNKQEEEQQ